MGYRVTIAAAVFLATAACQSEPARAAVPESRVQELERVIERLAPLQQRRPEPQPGDWLAQHDEAGQTFAQYVASRPTDALGKRRKIYLQPIGKFVGPQQKALAQTVELLRLYFQLEVEVNETIPLSEIPKQARRTHPEWGDRQILTTYVLYQVLKPRLPADAAVSIALTTSDLWPGRGWNFVFGQASLRDRVGVWSLHRNGDPAEAYPLFLRRTLKTATHEIGHIFGIHHEIRWACNMAGSNHREESDRQPLWLCHESLAKLAYATGANPLVRFQQLTRWFGKHGFKEEESFYQKSIAALAPR